MGMRMGMRMKMIPKTIELDCFFELQNTNGQKVPS